MRIKDLATRAAKLLSGNAYMVVDNGTVVNKIDYPTLAKELVEEYNRSTLAGSPQSVKTAIDALNSKTSGIRAIQQIPLNANSTVEITVSNGYRGTLFSHSASNAAQGLHFVTCSTSGGVTTKEGIATSSFTFNTSTANKLIVTSNSSSYILLNLITVSGTATV